MCSISRTSRRVWVAFLTSDKISLLYLVIEGLEAAALLNLLKPGICEVFANPQRRLFALLLERRNASTPASLHRRLHYS